MSLNISSKHDFKRPPSNPCYVCSIPLCSVFRLPSFPDVYSTAWLPLCISCCLQIIDAKGTRSVKIHDTCCEVVVSECGQFISGSRGMLSFRNP